MRQIALPISSIDTTDEFFVTDCNKSPYKFLIEDCNSHSIDRAILIGMEKSGKTKLAKIWLRASNGIYIDCSNDNLNIQKIHKLQRVALDNYEYADELELLHTINSCMRNNVSLLMLGYVEIHSAIPDLQSRLNASYRLEMLPPDNELAALMIQHMCFINRITITSRAVSVLREKLKFDSFVQLSEFKDDLLSVCKANSSRLTIKVLNNAYDNRHRL